MEKDKSFLTLSSAAIGFIIVILTKININSLFECVLYIISLLLFIATLILIIIIFGLNASHIEDVIKEESKKSKLLNVLDKTALFTFIFGMIFLAIIGISAVISNYSTQQIKEAEMNAQNKSVNLNAKVPETETRSLNGIGNLKPTTPSTQTGNQTNNSTNTTNKETK